MGVKLEDDKKIADDIKVYARTNYAKFKWQGTSIVGYDNNYERPKGRIIIPEKATSVTTGDQYDAWMEITSVDMRSASKLLSACLLNSYLLEIINLTGCSGLTTLYLFNTAITSLDLSSCSNLEELILSNTPITCIALSMSKIDKCCFHKLCKIKQFRSFSSL